MPPRARAVHTIFNIDSPAIVFSAPKKAFTGAEYTTETGRNLLSYLA
jgi:hypothetical protein